MTFSKNGRSQKGTKARFRLGSFCSDDWKNLYLTRQLLNECGLTLITAAGLFRLVIKFIFIVKPGYLVCVVICILLFSLSWWLVGTLFWIIILNWIGLDVLKFFLSQSLKILFSRLYYMFMLDSTCTAATLWLVKGKSFFFFFFLWSVFEKFSIVWNSFCSRL